ncbi:MAG: ribulose phosphate epimerase, partial [Pseudomonadota bacterium]
HEDPVEGGDQAMWFDRAMESHRRIVGRTPRGYRAPVYNITQDVIDLLTANGFRYDSSMMADDIPYRLQTPGGDLWELPPHWGTDDWPPFAHYAEIGYMMPVMAPSAGLAGFWEEFEAAYEAGGFFMLVVHPFLTGRLARWRLVERWLETTLAELDVWFAALEDIADHLDTLAAAGTWQPRIETLPHYPRPVLG